MSERQDVITSFEGAGVLPGIRWAYLSATARVSGDYSEAAGHDATWVGITRFTLFRDRLDRVFACGRYAVREGADAELSLDVLHAEHGLVERAGAVDVGDGEHQVVQAIDLHHATSPVRSALWWPGTITRDGRRT